MSFHGKDPVEVVKRIQHDLEKRLHFKSIEFSEKVDSSIDTAFAYLDFLNFPSSDEASIIQNYLINFLGPMDNYILLKAPSFAVEWDWGNNGRNFFTEFVYDTAKGLAHIEVQYRDRPAKPFAEKDTEKQLAEQPESKEDFDWEGYNSKMPGTPKKYKFSHIVALSDKFEVLTKVATLPWNKLHSLILSLTKYWQSPSGYSPGQKNWHEEQGKGPAPTQHEIDIAAQIANTYSGFGRLNETYQNKIIRDIIHVVRGYDKIEDTENSHILETIRSHVEHELNLKNVMFGEPDNKPNKGTMSEEEEDRMLEKMYGKDWEKDLDKRESEYEEAEKARNFDYDSYNTKMPGNPKKYVMSHILELANQFESLAKIASRCTECGLDNPYVDIEPYHCKLCKERKSALIGDTKKPEQKAAPSPPQMAHNRQLPTEIFHELFKILGKGWDFKDMEASAGYHKYSMKISHRDNSDFKVDKAKEFLEKTLGVPTDIGRFNTDWDHFDSKGYLIGMSDDGEFIHFTGFIDPQHYDKPPYK